MSREVKSIKYQANVSSHLTIALQQKGPDGTCYSAEDVSYLWPWSPHGPRPAAGLRGRCTAAVRQPHPWWTPVTRGSRNRASWEETRHSCCRGNCACSAGTQAPRTELGIGTLGRNQEAKLHELANGINRDFLRYFSTIWLLFTNTILIPTSLPLFETLTVFNSFNYFFSCTHTL